MNDTIMRLLTTTKTWAVVGCSPQPERDSHCVAQFLLERAFVVVPVNPHATSVLGRTCYRTLLEIPVRIDVVDIFRRSEEAGRHVGEAIGIGAAGVWMQLGVVDEAAAERAQRAGLDVVMDRCPKIELRRLFPA